MAPTPASVDERKVPCHPWDKHGNATKCFIRHPPHVDSAKKTRSTDLTVHFTPPPPQRPDFYSTKRLPSQHALGDHHTEAHRLEPRRHKTSVAVPSSTSSTSSVPLPSATSWSYPLPEPLPTTTKSYTPVASRPARKARGVAEQAQFILVADSVVHPALVTRGLLEPAQHVFTPVSDGETLLTADGQWGFGTTVIGLSVGFVLGVVFMLVVCGMVRVRRKRLPEGEVSL